MIRRSLSLLALFRGQARHCAWAMPRATSALVGEAEKAGHDLFAARVKCDSAQMVFCCRCGAYQQSVPRCSSAQRIANGKRTCAPHHTTIHPTFTSASTHLMFPHCKGMIVCLSHVRNAPTMIAMTHHKRSPAVFFLKLWSLCFHAVGCSGVEEHLGRKRHLMRKKVTVSHWRLATQPEQKIFCWLFEFGGGTHFPAVMATSSTPEMPFQAGERLLPSFEDEPGH